MKNNVFSNVNLQKKWLKKFRQEFATLCSVADPSCVLFYVYEFTIRLDFTLAAGENGIRIVKDCFQCATGR
jgi:hypothetical protein